jgi:SagB-type dehydrogenase family enzyme
MKDIGKLFMEFTKYEHLEQSDQDLGLPQPPLESGYDITKPVIKLPKIDREKLRDTSLIDAIERRRSVRKYDLQPLTLKELALLLWSTQGIKRVIHNKVTFRNVPSAGARHALDTYLLINRVFGLKPGLYKYIALDHALVEFDLSENIADRIVAACLGQGFIKSGNATFIWAADFPRMAWRYGERGYRYIHLDAGHVCQNLYLSARMIGCGVCAVAAYDDDAINQILGLDGEKGFVVYIGAVGKLPDNEDYE